MIVDCFPFNNEFDLLAARLEILDPLVDLFVIQEVGENFAGAHKGLSLDLNSPIFSEFREKIILIQRDSFPEELEPFQREWWQRDLAREWLLANLQDDDLLLYGDVDEIPKPETLAHANQLVRAGEARVVFFAMDMFYSFLNFREKSHKLLANLGEFRGVTPGDRRWIGSALWSWGEAKILLPSQLRGSKYVDLNVGVRLPDGGWHFSYVDGAGDAFSRFREKLGASAHQEFNNERVISRFEKRVMTRKDPLGRRGVRFEVLESLDFLPSAIQNLAARRPSLLAPIATRGKSLLPFPRKGL